jgi:hypothetical protein
MRIEIAYFRTREDMEAETMVLKKGGKVPLTLDAVLKNISFLGSVDFVNEYQSPAEQPASDGKIRFK